MTKNTDSVTDDRAGSVPQAQAQGLEAPPGRILPTLVEFFRRLFGQEPERSS